MKQLYTLLIMVICLAAYASLDAQTITFEENSSEFNNRTVTLTLEGQENGRNRYANRNVGDDFADVVVRWDGSRWVITDGNDMGGTNPGMAFAIYASNYDVGPNPPSLAEGNWQVLFAGEELVRLEGDGTQGVTLGFTLTAGPFTTDAGVQTGLGGGTPTGGVYSGPGVTDDGNGMTFSFDPMAAGVGTATIAYGTPGAIDNPTQTIEVTEALDVINIQYLDIFGTLTADGTENDRNRYRGTNSAGTSLTVRWSGSRWEIAGDIIGWISTYDVGPNPPDLATGNWQSLVNIELIRFDGSGTQAVDLAFTLNAGPFTTASGVQAGLGGGTPTGGVYSGPGVTDDGNGMTFSFDPMAAGVGTATISYGDGPDGANNVTQTIEVEEPAVTINFEDNFGTATLVQGEMINGRNSYSGTDSGGAAIAVEWNGMNWEIDFVNPDMTTAVIFTSSYDVGPNPPDLATGNWQNVAAGDVLIRFDGDGVQAVELGFTLAVTSYTTDDGVQAGLSGGTPNGGVYSGPGVTDDGNGMTFSFDPAAAGGGDITISYGDGPDGANNVTQMVEVLDLTEVCVQENNVGDGRLLLNVGDGFRGGQNFTACATGRVTGLRFRVNNEANTQLEINFNRGMDGTGPDYQDSIEINGSGEYTLRLDDPFNVVADSMYSFDYRNIGNGVVRIALESAGNPFAGGNAFDLPAGGNAVQFPAADHVFRLLTEIDSSAVSTRPDLLTSIANLTAFPNPTAGEFTVAYDLAQTSDVTVVLYDQQGRVLRKLAQGRQVVGAQRVTIIDNSLPAGVLYYGLQTERGHSGVKAIVVR